MPATSALASRSRSTLRPTSSIEASVPAKVEAFVDRMSDWWGAADLAISRSGAGTVCEIASFALPSVLVPYPFAQGHQSANAKVLEKAGVAIVIEQKDLTRPVLVEAIGRLKREGLTPAVVQVRVNDVFIKDPARRLAEAIESL